MPSSCRKTQSGPRRRAVAAVAIVGLVAGIAIAVSPSPSMAAGSPGLERMLGWVTRNNDLDDEFRADFIIRVPAGERPTLVQYDWNLDGSLDLTASLATGTGVDQQYQIVSVTSDGADDLIAITLRGDADYETDCASQPTVRDNHIRVTVPSGPIDITGFSTTIYNYDPCTTGATTRPLVRIPWDNTWGSPDGNSQDGWGAITTGGTLAANKAIVDADNPNTGTPANCGITSSVSYQWYRETGPGVFTPVGSMTTSSVTPHHGSTAGALSLGAQTLGGPGYYKLLAWPEATSSAGGADCSTRTYTPGDQAESFTVASVFNDFAPTAGAPLVHPAALAVAGLGLSVAGFVVVRRRRRDTVVLP